MKKARRKSWWLTTGIAIGFYIAVRTAQRGEGLEDEYDEYGDDEDQIRGTPRRERSAGQGRCRLEPSVRPAGELFG